VGHPHSPRPDLGFRRARRLEGAPVQPGAVIGHFDRLGRQHNGPERAARAGRPLGGRAVEGSGPGVGGGRLRPRHRVPGLVAGLGDQTWNARIQDLRAKQREQEDRRQRLAELRNRLKLAEQLAADHRYADALAILRNIPKEDRELLETINVSVLRMRAVIEEDAAKGRTEGENKQQLAAQLERAKRLADEGELSEALAAYDRIAAEFPAELVREKINIRQARENLQARIEAASKPPTPPPPSLTPLQIADAVAKLVEEANTLEKGEKFGEVLSKLEAVKNYDRKFWPEGLENRIESIKAKKEALEFFGMGADKRP